MYDNLPMPNRYSQINFSIPAAVKTNCMLALKSGTKSPLTIELLDNKPLDWKSVKRIYAFFSTSGETDPDIRNSYGGIEAYEWSKSIKDQMRQADILG